MESEHVVCVICNQDIGDRTVKFTAKTLDKSKSILKIRRNYNLKFNGISLPEEVNNNTGYHVKCYKNFLAVMKKYRQNEPSTLSNVPTSSAGDKVKRKWKNLRDTYVKELKKVPKHRSAAHTDNDPDYEGTWPYYESMSFLKTMLRPRKSEGIDSPEDPTQSTEARLEGNSDLTPNSPESFNGNMLDNNTVPIQDIATISKVVQQKTPSSIVPHKTYSPATVKPTRKRNHAKLKASLNTDRKKIKSICQSQQENNDDDFLWFQSILPYMKQLPLLSKLHVRTQVQELLLTELSKINTPRLDSLPENPSPKLGHRGRNVPEITVSNDDAQEHPDKDCPEYIDLATVANEAHTMETVDIKIEDTSVEMEISEHEVQGLQNQEDPLSVPSAVKIKTEPSDDRPCNSDAVTIKTEPSHDPVASSSSGKKTKLTTEKEEYAQLNDDGR